MKISLAMIEIHHLLKMSFEVLRRNFAPIFPCRKFFKAYAQIDMCLSLANIVGNHLFKHCSKRTENRYTFISIGSFKFSPANVVINYFH